MGETQWSYSLDGGDDIYAIPRALTEWCDGPDDAAEQAADHYYGIDPDTDMFPLELTLYRDGVAAGRYTVSIDWIPDFHASEVTP
jgi:hypothetical protein